VALCGEAALKPTKRWNGRKLAYVETGPADTLQQAGPVAWRHFVD